MDLLTIGVSRVTGKVDDAEPPYIALPLSGAIEATSLPRCALSNSRMCDKEFALDILNNLPRCIAEYAYTTVPKMTNLGTAKSF